MHCVFTSINNAYMSKAILLSQSVKRYHPDVWFVCVLVDTLDTDLSSEAPDIDEFLVAGEDLIDGFQTWIFEHTVVEACTGVKGPALHHLITSGKFRTVTYLDPDTYCYSRLSELFDDDRRASVLLTPHLTAPALSDRTIQANELSALRHGTFNLGFVSVVSDQDGEEFAAWWRDRTEHYSFDEIEKGIFTDQRWVDLAPSYFAFVEVFRHPGYNFSTWNAEHRRLSRQGDHLSCNGSPLRFVHYSGLDSGAHNAAREAFAPDDATFRELSEAYQEELALLEARLKVPNEWAYSRFTCGDLISKGDRRNYRDSPILKKSFPDPFASSNTLFSLISTEPIIRFEAEHGMTTADWLYLSAGNSSGNSRPAHPTSHRGSLDAVRYGLQIRRVGTQRPLVVHLSHGRGGGSDLHVRELMDATSDQCDSLWIRPRIGSGSAGEFDLTLRCGQGRLVFSAQGAFTVSELPDFVGSITPSVIHFHHLLGVEDHYRAVAEATSCPRLLTLHDFHLFTEDWTFHDLTDPSQEAVIRVLTQPEMVMSSRRREMLAFIDLMDQVIAPSRFVQTVSRQLLDDRNVAHIAHPEPVAPELVPIRNECLERLAGSQVIRAAVVGDLAGHKGLNQLLQLLLTANAQGHFLDVYHYGTACPDLEGLLIERGVFAREDLTSMIVQDGIDVALLLNTAPETYSYALSDVMIAGLPIVAFAVGAVPERLQGRRSSTLLPPESDGESILSALLSLKYLPDTEADRSATPVFEPERISAAHYLRVIEDHVPTA